MKKLARALILACLMTASQVCIFAGTNYEVKEAEYQFSQEGELMPDVPVLSINGEHYTPLEMMAEFYGLHVEEQAKDAKVINLVEGNSKDSTEKWMAFVKNTNRKVEESNVQLTYEKTPLQVSLVEVDGELFINMNDLAEFGGFYLVVNDKTKTIDFTRDSFKGVSEEQKKVYKEYLSQNAIPINLEKLDNKELIQKTGIDQHQVILYGEHHATVKNFEMELFLIKYLNQNQNIRHIFLEIGYCDTQLLNRYLETGDETILNNIMKNLKGTFAYSNQMYNFYKGIYEYNKTLPKDKKLVLIGVDIQHQTDTGMDYIMSLIPDKQEPQAIKKEIDSLRLMHKNKDYKAETLQSVLKSVEETNKAAYENYLGNDYKAFQEGVISILQLFECNKGSENDFMSIREKKMIQNFTHQYEQLNGEKCFGILGGAHIYLNQTEGEYNLASYINTEYGPTKGKVGSITAHYYNSFYMDSHTGKSMPMESGSFEALFAEAVEGDIVCVPLCKENSIFIQDGSAQTQQYIMLLKNSSAVTAYSTK